MGHFQRASLTEEDGSFCHAFQAEPNAVRDALRRAIARFARRIPDDAAGALELALAEVLNNIVEHAYAGLPPGPVELELRLGSEMLDCRVIDHGHPMPGLMLPKGEMQPIAATVDDLPEGGWGWALIKTLTTSLCYTRDQNANQLSFSVPVDAS
ncbi:MAG: ATP-binding protein [Rhodobacteraceae bacterium]|nr:ATP-binding protein [Paracoccaceae bacterium]